LLGAVYCPTQAKSDNSQAKRLSLVVSVPLRVRFMGQALQKKASGLKVQDKVQLLALWLAVPFLLLVLR
jgi:hypothetical protein